MFTTGRRKRYIRSILEYKNRIEYKHLIDACQLLYTSHVRTLRNHGSKHVHGTSNRRHNTIKILQKKRRKNARALDRTVHRSVTPTLTGNQVDGIELTLDSLLTIGELFLEQGQLIFLLTSYLTDLEEKVLKRERKPIDAMWRNIADGRIIIIIQKTTCHAWKSDPDLEHLILST
ncbi:hypothetical protein NPIL_148171 [Nephila pilipes]|uniref:Uncharacterized protein n=1 Tax=Nephila pilipes TaxID=299642 RepID=A0A8X6I9W4_NEPPI|nr:hypothetical protein NPIL_148171 [Nephila pilipes]